MAHLAYCYSTRRNGQPIGGCTSGLLRTHLHRISSLFFALNKLINQVPCWLHPCVGKKLIRYDLVYFLKNNNHHEMPSLFGFRTLAPCLVLAHESLTESRKHHSVPSRPQVKLTPREPLSCCARGMGLGDLGVSRTESTPLGFP